MGWGVGVGCGVGVCGGVGWGGGCDMGLGVGVRWWGWDVGQGCGGEMWEWGVGVRCGVGWEWGVGLGCGVGCGGGVLGWGIKEGSREPLFKDETSPTFLFRSYSSVTTLFYLLCSLCQTNSLYVSCPSQSAPHTTNTNFGLMYMYTLD